MAVYSGSDQKSDDHYSFASPSDLEKLLLVSKETERHILEYGTHVKVPASRKYSWYDYEWCRDTSYGVMYIDDFVSAAKKLELDDIKEFKKEIKTLESASKKILLTLWDYLDKERIRIEDSGMNWDLKDDGSKLAVNHVLSRFDVDKKGRILRAEPDRSAMFQSRSWLMQYDSVPLILISTANHLKKFGAVSMLDQLPVIRKNLDFLVEYMETFYSSPSADAWEQYYFHGVESSPFGKALVGKTIDSYTVSSIAAGLRAAQSIGSFFVLDTRLGKTNEITKFLSNYFISSDPEVGDFLCKSKIEYGDKINSIGSEEVEIFNTFKPGFENKDIEKNTIKMIEKYLFGSGKLPIRYKFFGDFKNVIDTYFGGGAWFHSGLQMAQYYIDNGRMAEAKKIIDYVTQRINPDGSIPEQEKPSGPLNDPSGYLNNNGGEPIQCLFWAETAYLSVSTKYMLKVAKRQ